MRSFHIFRYQILPNNRNFQGSIYDGKTVNDVLADKNNIFWKALTSSQPFATRRSNTVTRVIAKSEDLIVFMTGIARTIVRSTEDFKTERLDTWPNAIVAVWNDPDKQCIAIQHNPAAFSSPAVLLRNFEQNINRHLAAYQLGIYSKPIFSKNDFWALVASNEGTIEAVEFAFLTPNMASISKTLTEDLKELAKANNSVENKLELRANKGSALTIDPNDAQTSGLVDYASGGGGGIKLKLQSVRKRVTVGNTIKEIEIEGLESEGLPMAEVISIFKNMFDD